MSDIYRIRHVAGKYKAEVIADGGKTMIAEFDNALEAVRWAEDLKIKKTESEEE